MSIIEWKALAQQEAWLGYVGLTAVCAVLPSGEQKWPWQMQGRSDMIGALVRPARSFEEACWLAEHDVIGFIKSHELVQLDAEKAAVILDRTKPELGRILEYWEWREASGWDDPVEPAAA